MQTAVSGGEQRTRVANRYAELARSIFIIRGYAEPGNARLGQIVTEAMAGASAEELRSPDTIGVSAIGRLDQLVRSSVDADRPRNIHSAEAAQLARLNEQGLAGTLGHKGYGDLLRARAEARGEARDRAAAASGGGERYAALPSAGDKVPPAVMSAYVQQYAGTGVGRSTVQSFAAVGLNRPLYNEFRKEGFSTKQIEDNAKDSKILHFHGREDLKAAQHAPTDLRKAAVDVEKAKTPEDKEKKRKTEAGVARKYEALPDSDHRKHDARRFIERLERRGHHVEHGQRIGTRQRQHDAALDKEVGGHEREARLAQDQQANRFKKISTASLVAKDDDDFGTSAKPAEKTAEKPKLAAAKTHAGSKPA